MEYTASLENVQLDRLYVSLKLTYTNVVIMCKFAFPVYPSESKGPMETPVLNDITLIGDSLLQVHLTLWGEAD